MRWNEAQIVQKADMSDLNNLNQKLNYPEKRGDVKNIQKEERDMNIAIFSYFEFEFVKKIAFWKEESRKMINQLKAKSKKGRTS